MEEKRATIRLNDDVRKDKANQFVSILKTYTKDNPCPTEVLADETGLTQGQVRAIIKFMRRAPEEDFDKFIKYYPISSKRGYFMANEEHPEDYLPCFVQLYKWCESLKRTIDPMRVKLEESGINLVPYIYSGDEAQEDEETIPSIDKDSAWFME
jgi:hypothetical protein